jgi:hypothetical protein
MIFGLNLPNYSSLGRRDAVIAIAERGRGHIADFLGQLARFRAGQESRY